MRAEYSKRAVLDLLSIAAYYAGTGIPRDDRGRAIECRPPEVAARIDKPDPGRVNSL